MNDAISLTPPDRRTQRGIRSFTAGVTLTFITRVLMVAGLVGSSIIVARWLGPEGVGALAVLNVTVALGLQIGAAGLPSANTYFIARDKTICGSLWANSLIFAIAAGTLVAVSILILDQSQPSLFGTVRFQLLLIAGISIPFQLLSMLGLNILLALNRIDLLNLLDAAAPTLTLFNAVLILICLGLGLSMLVAFNTAAAVLLATIMIYAIARVSPRQSRLTGPDFSLLKQTLRYGGKFYVSIMAGVVIIRADLLIVNHYRGAAEAGVYAVASQVGNLLMMLPGVIATLLFPRVASDPDPRAEFAVRVTRHSSFIMIVLCGLTAAFSFVLPLIYGTRFSPAVIQLLILLPGVYLISVESVLVQHFTGTGLPLMIPVFWVITVAVNLTLNLALVPSWGARAAAINSSVSYGLIFVLVAVYFCRKTARPAKEIFFPRRGELRELLTRMPSGWRRNDSQMNLT